MNVCDVSVDKLTAWSLFWQLLRKINGRPSRLCQTFWRLAVEGFDPALELDQQGPSLAVQRLAGRYLDPSFADAVFLHIAALLVVEADTDFMFKNSRHMVRAARINRKWSGSSGRGADSVMGFIF